MNLTATLILAGSLVLASGCSSTGVETSYDYDPSVNFAELQTYAWETGEVVGDVNQFTIDRVMNITNGVLAAKGYRQDANPDFLITLHGGLTQVHDSAWGWSGLEFRNFEQGTIILHMHDASSRRMIWSGALHGEAAPNPSPEQQTQRLTEAINELLDSFPPM